MSDGVAIALITNLTIIVVAFLSRLWSHKEHKQTSQDVKDIKRIVNGGSDLPNETR